MLWVRRIGDLEARPLSGTEGAAYPFWSPDSRHLAFFTDDGKLRKIDTTGGPPVTICAAANGKERVRITVDPKGRDKGKDEKKPAPGAGTDMSAYTGRLMP